MMAMPAGVARRRHARAKTQRKARRVCPSSTSSSPPTSARRCVADRPRLLLQLGKHRRRPRRHRHRSARAQPPAQRRRRHSAEHPDQRSALAHARHALLHLSVKPGEPHTLWLDTRDRILPNGKSLYITIAAQSAEFSTDALEGAEVRLIFKPYKDALPEHIADRLTQVRDEFANLVEESVSSRRLNLFNRFDADITDLLRVDPAKRRWPATTGTR